jgi:hypothetical protein
MSVQLSLRRWDPNRIDLVGQSVAGVAHTRPRGVAVSARLCTVGPSSRRVWTGDRPEHGPSGNGDSGQGAVQRDGDAGDGPRLLTDGGQPTDSDDDRQRQLQQLFEELTGSASLVERQESDSRRCLDSQEAGLAADVAEVVESDGLSEAISSPETGDGMDDQ